MRAACAAAALALRDHVRPEDIKLAARLVILPRATRILRRRPSRRPTISRRLSRRRSSRPRMSITTPTRIRRAYPRSRCWPRWPASCRPTWRRCRFARCGTARADRAAPLTASAAGIRNHARRRAPPRSSILPQPCVPLRRGNPCAGPISRASGQ
ncbi:MAG: hypothetical protein U0Z44_03995 [Kouleothrix sp.]